MTGAYDAIEHLTNDMPHIEEEYANATQARLDQAEYILQGANITVDPYDPTEGPPMMPEPAEEGSGDGGYPHCAEGSMYVRHNDDQSCDCVPEDDPCFTDGQCQQDNQCAADA